MHRRNILSAALAATGALLAVAARSARAQTQTQARDATKVAYHLADLDRVAFVLGNIDNHLAGVGGPDRVWARSARHCSCARCHRLVRRTTGFTSLPEDTALSRVSFTAYQTPAVPRQGSAVHS